MYPRQTPPESSNSATALQEEINAPRRGTKKNQLEEAGKSRYLTA